MNTHMICHCGSQKLYSKCCEPFHLEQQLPGTPEALMRSRYSAYCSGNISYIEKTMRDKAREGFDPILATLWAQRVTWISLQILHTHMHSETHGQVEFIARFVDNKILQQLHELSEFQNIEGRWYYIDGTRFESRNNTDKAVIGRNSVCPCGSSKKWKHCHGKSNS
ncbi:MAG TPA: YchJ family protein [Legionellaceae bacterium]|nr:YchJ family protein [Legionellaceae bacterium]